MLDKKRILDLSYWFASCAGAFAIGCLWGLDIPVILASLLLLTFSFLKLYLHHRIEKSQILDLSYWFASCGMAFALGWLFGPNIPFMLAVLLLLAFAFLKLCLHYRIEKSQNMKEGKEGRAKDET